MKPIIFATLFAITIATSGYAGVMPEEQTFLIENTVLFGIWALAMYFYLALEK